jgi:hypothetical protein
MTDIVERLRRMIDRPWFYPLVLVGPMILVLALIEMGWL